MGRPVEAAKSAIALAPDHGVDVVKIGSTRRPLNMFGVAPVHADKEDPTFYKVGGCRHQKLGQKGVELVVRHLAAGGDELAMFDAASADSEPVDLNVVRRVGED